MFLFFLLSFNLGDWGGDGAKSSKSMSSTTAATPFKGITTTIPLPSSKSGKEVGLSTKSFKSGSTDLPTAGTAAMSLSLIQEPGMAEDDKDGGGLPQRDDTTIVTPTISPTRCNDNMVWYYDSNKGLCTNEEDDMDTAEDTVMIYESLGDCCNVHFNIRVSNDVGLDFDSNGIDNGGCISFDVCEVSWMLYYQTFNICLYLSFSYHHHHHHLIVHLFYINQIR